MRLSEGPPAQMRRTLSERCQRSEQQSHLDPASVPRLAVPIRTAHPLYLGTRDAAFCHPSTHLIFSFYSPIVVPMRALPFPKCLRGVLQEMRPRRISRNRRLPCQRHIRGVFAVWREAAVSALRSDPWPAAFCRPAETGAWPRGPSHLARSAQRPLSLFRQRRQLDGSAFARRLPCRIQNLHHHHVGIERSKVPVRLQPSVEHRRQVVEGAVVGRGKRRSASSLS